MKLNLPAAEAYLAALHAKIVEERDAAEALALQHPEAADYFRSRARQRCYRLEYEIGAVTADLATMRSAQPISMASPK